MSGSYIEKTVIPEERRRAFALDCVLRLMEPLQKERIVRGPEATAEKIVDFAKVFEGYLAGESKK